KYPLHHTCDHYKNEIRRQQFTRVRYDIAELAVDRLGEIAGEQQGKQSTSLLVWCARRVGQLRSDRGRGELSVGSSWVAGEQDELINQGRVIQGEDLGDESAQRPSQDAYALELERLDHSPGVVGELGDI